MSPATASGGSGPTSSSLPSWPTNGGRGDRARLDEFRHGDLAVRPHLRLAHERLTPAAARAFAMLGGLPVPSFPQWSVAALLDADPDHGATALEELLDARLVDAVGPDHAGQPRFRLHEVTRLYAKERHDRDVPPADRAAALSRVATAWLALARHARRRPRAGLPARAGWPSRRGGAGPQSHPLSRAARKACARVVTPSLATAAAR
ncbi:hypothetical protein ABGB16_18925 [Micromonospora sp. B11E3]|uniref:hypothetical protein n=1 Tax=Micromonospora sp. B11E3 TaxID=3153562 RepID=UPI00325D6C5E